MSSDLERAIQTLKPYSSSPVLDSKLLLMHILKAPLNTIHIASDIELTKDQQQELSNYLIRRKKGEPIAYIIGEVGFYDLILKVNPHVLIPRPETELLVETILSKFDNDEYYMCDLGTGSGAITAAIAKHRNNWKFTSVDVSQEALKIASQNLAPYNVELIISSWFDNINPANKFDIIVSNPPYIAENDHHLPDLSYEPSLALTSRENGLHDLKCIIENAKNYLKPNGMLLLEHGYDQQDMVAELLVREGYKDIVKLKDLAGLPRATYAHK